MLTAALVAFLAGLLWPARSPGRTSTRPPAAVRRAVDASDGSAPWFPAAELRERLRRRVRRRRPGDPWVADFAEVVAVGLAAGLDLPSAALVSARSPGVVAGAPWLVGHLREGVDAGRAVTTLLDGGPDLAGQEQGDLALLVSAWRLAERVGAAASAVTASAASSIRDRRATADRIAVVAAGPRASMVLLSALPMTGPVVAAVIGMPPTRLYDSPASRALAAVGVLLTLLGWWWARGLLRRAARPGCTGVGRP
ncbi:MAG TPA: hypothetical protein VES93_08795 [Ornithinibacter sp.]|nr:hypothetical protein [Ornithinibacter sp.]